MGWKRVVVNALLRGTSRTGAWDALRRASGRRLTVLAYHRVVDASRPGFDSYASNVSATPQAFREQMDHVRSRYDVIDLERVLRWLRAEGELPGRPLLITFDDGYRDNYENALPVLRERGLPAVLFVTSSFVGSRRALYWDRLARGLHRTRRASLSAPAIGTLRWTSERERAVALRVLMGRLKLLSDAEKDRLVTAVLAALEVDADEGERLAMSWDELREMEANGFSIGGHTQSHAILSRLPLAEARAEICGCMARLQSEGLRPAPAFAYTNGLEADFGEEHERLLAEAGVRVAFTLLPGPSSWDEVRARPLAIRRIAVRRGDDRARFEARLAGVARLTRDRL